MQDCRWKPTHIWDSDIQIKRRISGKKGLNRDLKARANQNVNRKYA